MCIRDSTVGVMYARWFVLVRFRGSRLQETEFDGSRLLAAGCTSSHKPPPATSHQPPAPPSSQQPAAWIQGLAAVAVASEFVLSVCLNVSSDARLFISDYYYCSRFTCIPLIHYIHMHISNICGDRRPEAILGDVWVPFGVRRPISV